jgi:hypothetical protein
MRFFHANLNGPQLHVGKPTILSISKLKTMASKKIESIVVNCKALKLKIFMTPLAPSHI